MSPVRMGWIRCCSTWTARAFSPSPVCLQHRPSTWCRVIVGGLSAVVAFPRPRLCVAYLDAIGAPTVTIAAADTGWDMCSRCRPTGACPPPGPIRVDALPAMLIPRRRQNQLRPISRQFCSRALALPIQSLPRQAGHVPQRLRHQEAGSHY